MMIIIITIIYIKVGPHRWYYHADRLGFFVYQDMPETIHGTGRGATFTQVTQTLNPEPWILTPNLTLTLTLSLNPNPNPEP